MIGGRFLLTFFQVGGYCVIGFIALVFMVAVVTFVTRLLVDLTEDYLGWNFEWAKDKWLSIQRHLPFEFAIKRLSLIHI